MQARRRKASMRIFIELHGMQDNETMRAEANVRTRAHNVRPRARSTSSGGFVAGERPDKASIGRFAGSLQRRSLSCSDRTTAGGHGRSGALSPWETFRRSDHGRVLPSVLHWCARGSGRAPISASAANYRCRAAAWPRTSEITSVKVVEKRVSEDARPGGRTRHQQLHDLLVAPRRRAQHGPCARRALGTERRAGCRPN